MIISMMAAVLYLHVLQQIRDVRHQTNVTFESSRVSKINERTGTNERINFYSAPPYIFTLLPSW